MLAHILAHIEQFGVRVDGGWTAGLVGQHLVDGNVVGQIVLMRHDHRFVDVQMAVNGDIIVVVGGGGGGRGLRLERGPIVMVVLVRSLSVLHPRCHHLFARLVRRLRINGELSQRLELRVSPMVRLLLHAIVMLMLMLMLMAMVMPIVWLLWRQHDHGRWSLAQLDDGCQLDEFAVDVGITVGQLFRSRDDFKGLRVGRTIYGYDGGGVCVLCAHYVDN